MKNLKRNISGKPQNTQRNNVDPKVRTLARLAEYSYHRNPISTVVIFGLAIITAPIWYPIGLLFTIGLLFKYRALIMIAFISLALTYIPIKVYDHYIGKPQRESVLIKAKEVKDRISH